MSQDDLDLLLDSPSSLTVTVSCFYINKHEKKRKNLLFYRLVDCDVCFQSNTRGTVKDKANFKVEEDVSALRKAIEGLGKLTDINEPLL